MKEELQRICTILDSRRALVFVGAGLSIPLGYPDWRKLITDLVDAAVQKHPERRGELSQWKKPNVDSLVAASECKKALDSAYFEKLGEWFERRTPAFSEEHEILVSLPFRHLLTTNYDPCLMEALHQKTQELCHPITHADREHIGRVVVDIESLKTSVVHLHGSHWQPRQIILTNEDYQRLYADPGFIECLKALFFRPILFVGYSLTDWDFMALMRYLEAVLPPIDRNLFAILPADDDVATARQTLKAKYGINSLFYPVGFNRDHSERKALLRAIADEFRVTTTLRTGDKRPTIAELESRPGVTRSSGEYAAHPLDRTPPLPQMYVVHRFPAPSFWVGRIAQLEKLARAVEEEKTRFLIIQGFGGEGKSSLMNRFLDCIERKGIFDGIFWWSFYEQASHEDFVETALRYFSNRRYQLGQSRGPSKIQLLLDLLGEKRFFVLLDGFEQMLFDIGHEREGFCQSQEMALLLRGMAAGPHKSHILLTTRMALNNLTDLNPARIDLEGMELEDAVAFMRKWGVIGSDGEIADVCESYGCHALSLLLLAQLLVGSYGGKIEGARQVPSVIDVKTLEKGRKIMRLLDEVGRKISADEKELLMILSALRPSISADDAYRLLSKRFPNDYQLRLTLYSLRQRSLISTVRRGGKDYFSAHPIVRKYFQMHLIGEDPKLLSAEIRDFIRGKPLPYSLERIEHVQPLLDLWHYTCDSGLLDEAVPIFQGWELGKLLVNTWGSYDHYAEPLSYFLKKAVEPGMAVTPANYAWVANELALVERYRGNLRSALDLYQKALDRCREDVIIVQRVKINLAQLLLLMGEIREASRYLEDERQVPEGTEIERFWKAVAFFLSGNVKESELLFAETSTVASEGARGFRLSHWGICLLVGGQYAEARLRLEQAVILSEATGDVSFRGRALLGLARLMAAQGERARAVEFLLRAQREVVERMADSESEIHLQLARAQLNLLAGEWAKAQHEALQGASMSADRHYRIFQCHLILVAANAKVGLAREERELSLLREAGRDAKAVLELANEIGYYWARSEASQLGALVRRELGDSHDPIGPQVSP